MKGLPPPNVNPEQLCLLCHFEKEQIINSHSGVKQTYGPERQAEQMDSHARR